MLYYCIEQNIHNFSCCYLNHECFPTNFLDVSHRAAGIRKVLIQLQRHFREYCDAIKLQRFCPSNVLHCMASYFSSHITPVYMHVALSFSFVLLFLQVMDRRYLSHPVYTRRVPLLLRTCEVGWSNSNNKFIFPHASAG